MKRACFLFALIIFLSGCATYYRVRVNGYLDTYAASKPLSPGASFCVLENKNTRNPILESEIKFKIERLLAKKGFKLQPYEKADLFLTYNYSMGSGRNVYEARPVYTPGDIQTIQTRTSTGKEATSIVTLPGYYTYVPYRLTVYTASLNLRVLDANQKTVWIGEISSTSENPDLREAIDYLLAAGFGRFGENTGRSITTSVYEKDIGQE